MLIASLNTFDDILGTAHGIEGQENKGWWEGTKREEMASKVEQNKGNGHVTDNWFQNKQPRWGGGGRGGKSPTLDARYGYYPVESRDDLVNHGG